jgi:uncharacterized membrane protein
MGKVNWKQKLTSRKFISAIIGFVTAILLAFNVSDLTIEQVVAIMSSILVLVAYILGEASVDTERVKMEYLDRVEEILLEDEDIETDCDENCKCNISD